MVKFAGKEIAGADIAKRTHYLTGMLVFGTCTSISSKIQLSMFCTGWGGVIHTFDKPFFQSILMFGAMALALVLAIFVDLFNKVRATNATHDSEALLKKEKEDEGTAKKGTTSPLIMLIPCVFDLLASTIMTFGLIYISVSVFQMLRGSMMIFSTILSRIFLGRHVKPFQMVGLGVSCVALVVVGIAGTQMPQAGVESTAAQTLIGCALVVFSQLIQAGQLVTEEFLLKNLSLPPLKIVGYEGVWGTLLMVLVACPAAYVIPGTDFSTMPHNSLENTWDSLLCMVTSAGLIGSLVVFFVAVLMYNVYGMLITDSFNAVNRTIFEAVRTTCIWVTDLIIYVIWPTSGFGEIWSAWSWLELFGFSLLILATFLYNGILKIPFFNYTEEGKAAAVNIQEEGDSKRIE